MQVSLPKLDYSYEALEPYIDAKTMKIHHGKHHQGYVNKLKAVLEGRDEVKGKSLEEMLMNVKKLPEDMRLGVRNNGGGHWNHKLYWEGMGKDRVEPKGKLLEAIERDYGSVGRLKQKFTDMAMGRFGSGWTWLGMNEEKRLVICSTQNQDNPLMKGVVLCNCQPILGLDVWEHAYYLKYQNRRDEYIKNWWQVVNWKKVEEGYEKRRE